uniref:Uncharacterized protein n=1 Tax=Arundo donax TaxID=35708 RepID=A0A0A9CZ69_ARUDO
MVASTRSPYFLTFALPMPFISKSSSFVLGTRMLISLSVSFLNMWYALYPSLHSSII